MRQVAYDIAMTAAVRSSAVLPLSKRRVQVKKDAAGERGRGHTKHITNPFPNNDDKQSLP